jgi:hypothetical protein
MMLEAIPNASFGKQFPGEAFFISHELYHRVEHKEK